MGCKKEFIKSSVGKKILSSYIVGLLLLTSFSVVVPIASADGTDDLKKMLMIIIVGIIFILLACVNIYFKVANLTGGATGGVI